MRFLLSILIVLSVSKAFSGAQIDKASESEKPDSKASGEQEAQLDQQTKMLKLMVESMSKVSKAAMEGQGMSGSFPGIGSSSTLNQRCAKPEFACGECETNLQEDFNNLLNSYISPPMSTKRWADADGKFELRNGANFDEFLQKAVEVMKKNNPKGDNKLNMIVIGNSESLHGTTPGHPRVALKSPDGEFWLTFNTDPNASGYNSIEIMRWDGKSGSYKFQEVTFPKDGQRPHADLTGQKCSRCHREPMRPNWDTYRAWSNVLPPRDDLVESDEKGKLDIAGRSYVNFLRSIANAKKNPNDPKNKRLSLLEIPAEGKTDEEKIANINQMVSDQGFFRVPHYPPKNKLGNFSEKTAPLAGSSHLGFDQLSGQNSCRIVNDLKKNPAFDNFKYAITGIIFCGVTDYDKDFKPKVKWSELKKYAPEKFQNEALSYFKSSTSLNLKDKKLVPKDKDEVLDRLFEHTNEKHKAVDRAKNERSRKMLRSYASLPGVKGSEAEVNEFLKKRTNVSYPYTAIEDPGGVKSVDESNPSEIASMRYFLEPLGVNVGGWSMVNESNVGESTFSFSDQFMDIIQEQQVFKTVWEETPGGSKTKKCENLQEASRNALEKVNGGVAASSGPGEYLNKMCGNYSLSEERIAQQIKAELGKNTCLVCHEKVHTHISEIFGPRARQELNRSTGNGSFIKDHVKKMLREGRMPPGGFGIGSNEKERLENDRQRRETLIRYVDYVSGDAGLCPKAPPYNSPYSKGRREETQK